MKKKLTKIAATLLIVVSSASVLSGCTSNDVCINTLSKTWTGLSGSPVAGKSGYYEYYTTYDAVKPRKDGKKETIYKAYTWDGEVYYVWKSTVDKKWYFSKNYK